MSCVVCQETIQTKCAAMHECNHLMCQECFVQHLKHNGRQLRAPQHQRYGVVCVYCIKCPICRGESSVHMRWTGAACESPASLPLPPRAAVSIVPNEYRPSNYADRAEKWLCVDPTNEPNAYQALDTTCSYYPFLLPGMLPLPRRNQLYTAIGYRRLVCDTEPTVRDAWSGVCEVCGEKRASFPYRVQDNNYDNVPVSVLHACTNCVTPRGAKPDTNAKTLSDALEKPEVKLQQHSAPHTSFALRKQLLDTCYRKSGADLDTAIEKLSCFTQPSVITFELFKGLLDVYRLATTAFPGGEPEKSGTFIRKCIPKLVRFGDDDSHKSTDHVLHKCLRPAERDQRADVRALLIYFARRGVFDTLYGETDTMSNQGYFMAYSHVNNFVQKIWDLPDTFFAERSPTFVAEDEEMQEAKRELERAQQHYETLKRRKQHQNN